VSEASGALASRPRVAFAGEDQLGEGPYWSATDGRLWWVDILAPAIHSVLEGSDKRRTIALQEPVGVAVPHRDGGLLAAIGGSICRVHEDGAVSCLCSPEADRPRNRFNDGKCDSRGRLWVGSLSQDGTNGAGRLWRVDTEGMATTMIDDLDICNGIGWSPDERWFYVTDSGRGVIYTYAFDPGDGELGERRTFARIAAEDGVPDGLAVDAEGFVWSVRWDGSAVARHDPDGAVEQLVQLPVPRPTSCAFGGDELSTLYVTSARAGLSASTLAEAPASGSILAVDTSTRGSPVYPYGSRGPDQPCG